MDIMTQVLGHRANTFANTASPLLVSDGRLGIEVELERLARAPSPLLDALIHWEIVTDGSLHDHGLEFRFRQPMFGVDAVNALEELQDMVEKYKAYSGDDDSRILGENTSVHVHLDCIDLTNTQLYNLIMLSIFMEQVLFSYAAPERENNIFSVSIAKASGEVGRYAGIISHIMEGSSEVRYTLEDASKYASINLKSLMTFGTIEYRAHKGCYDAERLVEWCNILLSLKEFVKQDNVDIVALAGPSNINNSATEILSAVFGESLGKVVHHRSIIRDLTLGSKLVMELSSLLPNNEYDDGAFASSLVRAKEGSLITKYTAESSNEEAPEQEVPAITNENMVWAQPLSGGPVQDIYDEMTSMREGAAPILFETTTQE